MFDSLTDRLQDIFKKLRGHAKLDEKHVEEVAREIRLALLEADVNFKVVKEFIEHVKERAVGQEVLERPSPRPSRSSRSCDEELIALLGPPTPPQLRRARRPSVIMLVGLQGSGKTTTAAKLARNLKKQRAPPLLVAADVYRPAAIEQLETLGQQHRRAGVRRPRGQARAASRRTRVEEAAREGHDTVIVDTAGRLHIDDELMDELVRIKERSTPTRSCWWSTP